MAGVGGAEVAEGRQSDSAAQGGGTGKAIVRTAAAASLSLGELSSATSGSLTVALRAATSELRETGLLVPAGTSVSKHRQPRRAPLLVLP
jgi:hypothetical protein